MSKVRENAGQQSAAPRPFPGPMPFSLRDTTLTIRMDTTLVVARKMM